MERIIIVTGCTKRIGLGIVNLFLQNSNFKIVGIVRSLSKELNDLCLNYPNKIQIIIKDFEKDFLDVNVFQNIIDQGGQIVGFVHCASNLIYDNFSNYTNKNLISQNRIHYGVFNQAILSYLEVFKNKKNNIKDIASFINFGDYKVFYGKEMGFSYTKSKLLAMKEIKYQALMSLGYIRVNMISPGYILPTEGYSENFEKIIEKFPFKYTSTIEDIYKTVDFIIKQKSITGQHIVLDAGAGLVDNI